MRKTFTFQGTKEQLETLEHLFRHVEYLGEVGASRNLLVRVDGDGEARLKVYNEDGFKINEEQYSIDQNKLHNCSGVYDLD